MIPYNPSSAGRSLVRGQARRRRHLEKLAREALLVAQEGVLRAGALFHPERSLLTGVSSSSDTGVLRANAEVYDGLDDDKAVPRVDSSVDADTLIHTHTLARRITMTPPQTFLDTSALSQKPSYNGPIAIGQGGQAVLMPSQPFGANSSPTDLDQIEAEVAGVQAAPQLVMAGSGSMMEMISSAAAAASASVAASGTMSGVSQSISGASAVSSSASGAAMSSAGSIAASKSQSAARSAQTSASASGRSASPPAASSAASTASDSYTDSASSSPSTSIAASTSSSMSASSSASASISSAAAASTSLAATLPPKPFTQTVPFIFLMVFVALVAFGLLATLLSCILKRRKGGRRKSANGYDGSNDGMSDLVAGFDGLYPPPRTAGRGLNEKDASGLGGGESMYTTRSFAEGDAARIIEGLPAHPASTMLRKSSTNIGAPQPAHLFGETGPLEVRNAAPGEIDGLPMPVSERMFTPDGKRDLAWGQQRPATSPWRRSGTMDTDETDGSLPSPFSKVPPSGVATDLARAHSQASSQGGSHHLAHSHSLSVRSASLASHESDHDDVQPTRAGTWASNLRSSLFAAIAGGRASPADPIGHDDDIFTRTILPLHRRLSVMSALSSQSQSEYPARPHSRSVMLPSRSGSRGSVGGGSFHTLGHTAGRGLMVLDEKDDYALPDEDRVAIESAYVRGLSRSSSRSKAGGKQRVPLRGAGERFQAFARGSRGSG